MDLNILSDVSCCLVVPKIKPKTEVAKFDYVVCVCYFFLILCIFYLYMYKIVVNVGELSKLRLIDLRFELEHQPDNLYGASIFSYLQVMTHKYTYLKIKSYTRCYTTRTYKLGLLFLTIPTIKLYYTILNSTFHNYISTSSLLRYLTRFILYTLFLNILFYTRTCQIKYNSVTSNKALGVLLFRTTHLPTTSNPMMSIMVEVDG